MSKNRKKKSVSCLGILLVFCMLIVAAVTLAVNLSFRNGKTLTMMESCYVYYTYEDMGDRVPAGSLVIVEEPNMINVPDIVLYENNAGEKRIAVVSLIVDAVDATEGNVKTYYLTTAANSTAVQATETDILGRCTRRSPELGFVIGLLLDPLGVVLGLILPCVLIIIYLISVIAAGAERADDMDVDENNDIEFVKSIQKKQQRIAERDAARREQRRRETQTFDKEFYEAEATKKTEETRKPPRLSEEEMARLEEEEAARRAERIAAVRSHMEQRRQTETPDGVPLYTTEIIKKTHTMSIPRTGAEQEKKEPVPQLNPVAAEQTPRLTATGHILIPTPEQIEAEKRAHDEKLAKRVEPTKPVAEEEATPVIEEAAPVVKEAAPIEEPAIPVVEEVAAMPETEPVVAVAEPMEAIAEETVETPTVVEEVQPVVAEPVVEADAPVKETVAPAPKPAAAKKKKQRIASSSYQDLMAFLDKEQKKR